LTSKALRSYPLISVVIATCKARQSLRACVRSILACDYQEVEVIVVHNGPFAPHASAVLGEELAADERVHVLDEPRIGLSRARNAGLARASGEIVAFTDDDVAVDAGWLRAIADSLGPGVGCVTGLILPLSIETATQRTFEQFAGFGKGGERRCFRLADGHADPLFPYSAGTFGSGANTALRRSTALRLGGFDVRLGAGTPACGGEDLDMYIRVIHAGESIVYQPEAVIFHNHPTDELGLRRRVFTYGVGLSAMLIKQMLSGPRLPLLRRAIAGLAYLLDPHSRKNARKGTDYPTILTVLEWLGIVAGPIGYALSARRARAEAGRSPVGDRRFATAAARVVELERPLGEIRLGRTADGRHYESVLALMRLHGEPRGLVEIEARQGTVPASALAAAASRMRSAPLCRDDGRGSPASCAAAAELPPRARRVDQIDPPFVSVIVPTAGRPQSVETCLSYLRRLCYPHFEIIVVDNAPDVPETRAVVESCAASDRRVRYVAEARPGSSVARNRGVREALGKVLAFTDDDVMVDAEWLSWMVEPFLIDPRVGVVTGLVLPARFETQHQRWFEEVNGFGKGFARRLFDLDAHRADTHLLYPYWGGVFGSGNSMAFEPDLLRRIGGFDPALGAGSPALAGADIESFSHAILAGSRLAYEPRAVCWHDHRADAAAVDRQTFSYSVGLTAILTKWALRDRRVVRLLSRELTRSLAALVTARTSEADVPRELGRFGRQLRMNRQRKTLGRQLRGYVWGPALYLRSVRWARRLRLHDVLDERGARR
jgi:GT2 family glycosyltransferase